MGQGYLSLISINFDFGRYLEFNNLFRTLYKHSFNALRNHVTFMNILITIVIIIYILLNSCL